MGEEMWHSSNKCDRFVSVVHVSVRRLDALTQSGDQARSESLSAGGEDLQNILIRLGSYND